MSLKATNNNIDWQYITKPTKIGIHWSPEDVKTPSTLLTKNEKIILGNYCQGLLALLEQGIINRITDYTGNYFIIPKYIIPKMETR